MADIKKEESEYMPMPKFYTFKSRDERECILYKNFVQVGEDVKAMIAEIFNKKNAKWQANDTPNAKQKQQPWRKR